MAFRNPHKHTTNPNNKHGINNKHKPVINQAGQLQYIPQNPEPCCLCAIHPKSYTLHPHHTS